MIALCAFRVRVPVSFRAQRRLPCRGAGLAGALLFESDLTRVSRIEMPGFSGVDASEFPGQAEMNWLRANTNADWCGYYLAPAPSHSSTSWMGRRASLKAAGWGLAPTYLGQQLAGLGSHKVSAGQGQIDGGDAARLMTAEGFAPGAYVYLDLEDGPPFSEPRIGYVDRWISAVSANGFRPGVYCSHSIAAAVHQLSDTVRIWAYKVETSAQHPFPGTNFPDLHPSGCGYTGAYMWQLGQNCRLSLGTVPPTTPLVDLNTALSPDPSA